MPWRRLSDIDIIQKLMNRPFCWLQHYSVRTSLHKIRCVGIPHVHTTKGYNATILYTYVSISCNIFSVSSFSIFAFFHKILQFYFALSYVTF